MKKNIILLLLSLSIATFCFSQNTYPKSLNDSLVIITTEQLKQTNLIFLEKNKLELQNSEYKKQIDTYKTLINNYSKTDSLRLETIDLLNNEIANCEEIIIDRNNQIYKLENKNKLWKGLTIGGFTVSATLLILLLVR